MTEYGRKLLEQENEFVKGMLVEYGIREVTTDKQAKNGTRELEFPVPCYSKQRLKWYKRKKYDLKDLPRLRIASFKSGYVRKQNGADRAYQINPVYMQNYQCVWQRDNGQLYTSNGVNRARAQDLPRLRIASFKSGYVRKQNGADRAYQINPVYMQNYQCVWQRDNGQLYISNGVNRARALIHSPIVRLNYILQFYLRNYANN